ncbi:MAG TPA: polyhydroxyalkanoic acid system family protein [Kofleriaceae bacterium]|nr:polyhydroxyalkanoic acid system family protein [Kofleriaceae bacterium]
MHIEHAHSFTKEDATARLRALGDYLQRKHGIRVSWSGDKASFSGKYMIVSIQGEMTVGEGRVSFSGKDPGLLWRKKATAYIENKLRTYLDPATPIDDLPR